jgi:hypothetical protein
MPLVQRVGRTPDGHKVDIGRRVYSPQAVRQYANTRWTLMECLPRIGGLFAAHWRTVRFAPESALHPPYVRPTPAYVCLSVAAHLRGGGVGYPLPPFVLAFGGVALGAVDVPGHPELGVEHVHAALGMPVMAGAGRNQASRLGGRIKIGCCTAGALCCNCTEMPCS